MLFCLEFFRGAAESQPVDTVTIITKSADEAFAHGRFLAGTVALGYPPPDGLRLFDNGRKLVRVWNAQRAADGKLDVAVGEGSSDRASGILESNH
jgi:hypothetical protein